MNNLASLVRAAGVFWPAIVLFLSSPAMAAKISGHVTDQNGEPMAGIWITVDDPTLGCRFCSTILDTGTDPSGYYEIEVDDGRYTLVAHPVRPLRQRWHRVAVNGNDITVDFHMDDEDRDMLPDAPPVASLIDVGVPDAGGNLEINGRPGAVTPNSSLVFVNLDTADIAFADAGQDGSFSVSTRGWPGSTVHIKSDPSGYLANETYQSAPLDRTGGSDLLSVMPATMVRVPRSSSHDGPNDAEGSGLTLFHEEFGDYSVPEWTFAGSTNRRDLDPGDTLRLQGTVSLVSEQLASTDSVSCDVSLKLEKLSDASGTSTMGINQYASSNLTTTGFPIERMPRFVEPGDGYETFEFQSVANDRLEGDLDVSMRLPSDLPHGYYRPYFTLCWPDVPHSTPPEHHKTVLESHFTHEKVRLTLPLIRVGSPASPRLFLTLLSDTPDNGSRGVTADEDAGHLGFSPRVTMLSRDYVIPKTLAGGSPAVYRLEPFAPQVSWGDRVPPLEPKIQFRFPSGGLKIRITQPDGSSRVIGPLPFRQARTKSLSDGNGSVVATGGGQPTDLYQLSTMDPAFDVVFSQDGPHTIEMEAEIDDVWGNTWTGGGTYHVNVAQRLVADTTVLPGTPFEVGDEFLAGVTLHPAVAADVKATLTLDPYSDPSQRVTRVVEGKANRFGHFRPTQGGLPFTEPGEYRFDIVAEWKDEDGKLWMGSRSFGGVVAPDNSTITAHGRRGTDTQPETGQAWYSQEAEGLPVPAHHANLPFFSGDVLWVFDEDSITTTVTFDEQGSEISNLMRARIGDYGWADTLDGGATLSERISIGEIPLWSSQPDGRDPHFDPGKVDLWSYSYRSIQRPMVRVREFVAEDQNDSPYWRFNEQYNRQVGMGLEGDLPNDIKFQYGGAVVRGDALSQPRYAIYGSTAVIMPQSDNRGGYRVFPPFQGNGGGPSGGPILVHKGEDVDLVANLRSARPGSVYEIGDTFSLSGAIAPALPTHLRYTVTRPDGSMLSFARNDDRISNRVGYFYLPEDDFQLDQAGIWTVKFEAEFSGRTSAGQTTAPYPTGSVLGATDATFSFYVTDRGGEQLGLGIDQRDVILPEWREDGPHFNYELQAVVPDGYTVVRGHVTTMMPGTLLDSRALGSDLGYSLDINALATEVPNLDWRAALADALTVSLYVEATDPDGQPVHLGRVVNILGDEVYAMNVPASDPVPEPFAINAGHAGAWFNPETAGQGQLIDVSPEAGLMFISWFTYTAGDSDNPDQQQWYTAQGNYHGASATLDLYETLGGQFDDPQAVTTTRVGSVTLTFEDCQQGTMAYDFDDSRPSGSFPLRRVAPKPDSNCQPGGASTQAVNVNRGMQGAWFNPETAGQGILFDVLATGEDAGQLFGAWFTYGNTTASGQRWLTAQGGYSGAGAEIDVFETTGGRFDDPQAVSTEKVGTMTVEFVDCVTVNVSYDLGSEGLQGQQQLVRAMPGGESLCEALSPAD